MAQVTKTRTYSIGDQLTNTFYNADRDEVIAGVNSINDSQIAVGANIALTKLAGSFPTGAIVGTTDSQTLTNKSITSPNITGTVTGTPAMQTVMKVATYSPAGGGTATLDLSAANRHVITMPAGNITIALSNETVNQPFLIEIIQDSVGSRTVTWFSTIRWVGGANPTLTTTANKKDTLGIIVTSSGNYDGYVVGQNL